MALLHKFRVVDSSTEKTILYSEESYDYFDEGIIVQLDCFELRDELIDELLYTKEGKENFDFEFSRWGIDVYETEDLIKWEKLLENYLQKSKVHAKFWKSMLDFIKRAISENRFILHFGI